MTTLKIRGSLIAVLFILCAAGALAASQAGPVPFVVRGQGTLTPLPDGTLSVSAGGVATHLGRYVGSGIQIVRPGMPPTFEGHVTLAAANGDEVYVTVIGILTSPPPDAAGQGQYEITGGTGRFEGASGEGSFSANAQETRFDGFIRFGQ
jgi:hypothetical protein